MVNPGASVLNPRKSTPVDVSIPLDPCLPSDNPGAGDPGYGLYSNPAGVKSPSGVCVVVNPVANESSRKFTPAVVSISLDSCLPSGVVGLLSIPLDSNLPDNCVTLLSIPLDSCLPDN